MTPVLPMGPLIVRVSIIGFDKGLPVVIADIESEGEVAPYCFKKQLGRWVVTDANFNLKTMLNSEENDILETVWTKECKKKGIK